LYLNQWGKAWGSVVVSNCFFDGNHVSENVSRSLSSQQLICFCGAPSLAMHD